MRGKTFLLAIGLILLGAPTAFATIILDSSGAVSYQQTTNNPCVIGNPSCNQDGFGYMSAPSAPDYSQYTATSTPGAYDLFSPNAFYNTLPGPLKYDPNTFTGPYTVNTSQTGVSSPGTIPGSFTIGIDVNYNNGREQLVAFKTWVYDGSGDINSLTNWQIDTNNSWNNGDVGHPSPYLLEVHNGNGFSDAILTGFNLSNGQKVFFEAIYGAPYVDRKPVLGSDDDGMEQFFIIPAGTPQVPEPGTLFLLGAGLFGLAMATRRREKK